MAKWCRQNALALGGSALGLLVIGWLGLYGFAWNDYDTEAAPAVGALTGGHLGRFLQLAPAYGGSLELRAPFEFLPALWGGGALAIYRAAAAPCLLAGALLGIHLVGSMRARGAGMLARATVLALCVVNPITLRALELGHAEELLGSALCAGAVLFAMREHAIWAGIMLGLAVANKEWALLATGPVLLALPSRRIIASLAAVAVAAAFLAPLLAAHTGGLTGAPQLVAAGSGEIFQPWQAWWFLGSHGHLVHGLFGAVKSGYRTPPGWIGSIAHPLIGILWLPLTALCALRRRPRFGDPLLLLALVMLLRCALDPWDTAYYALPFLLALLTWEAVRSHDPPVRSLAATVAVWIVFQELPARISPDAQAVVFAAVALLSAAALALALWRPRLSRLRQPRRRSAVSQQAAGAS